MQQPALAKDQNIDFLSHFAVLDDPRQQGKVGYPLEEILLLVLSGVIAGAEGWVEIQKFGQKKLDFNPALGAASGPSRTAFQATISLATSFQSSIPSNFKAAL